MRSAKAFAQAAALRAGYWIKRDIGLAAFFMSGLAVLFALVGLFLGWAASMEQGANGGKIAMIAGIFAFFVAISWWSARCGWRLARITAGSTAEKQEIERKVSDLRERAFARQEEKDLREVISEAAFGPEKSKESAPAEKRKKARRL